MAGFGASGRPRIAFVTIGQAPRPDVVPEILSMLDGAPEHDEFGALDGLDRATIARRAPRPHEARLYTRLADASHVVVASPFIEERLARLMHRLDGQGYGLIALITTGVFRPLDLATPLVHGQRALDAWIAALVLGSCQLGVIYPLIEQSAAHAHGALLQNARTAAAAGESARLEDAAARLAEADLILMHSVGYTEAMAREVARRTGKPVVTARRIIAGAIRLQMGLLSPAREAPLVPDLIGRLPPPTARLTRRERDVLAHVLAGESSKGVGRLLGISHRTVESHRARAMAKFGAASTAELVRRALMGRSFS